MNLYIMLASAKQAQQEKHNDAIYTKLFGSVRK
jgi:hypothetical protein